MTFLLSFLVRVKEKKMMREKMNRRQKLFRMMVAFFSFVLNDLRFSFRWKQMYAMRYSLLGGLKKRGLRRTQKVVCLLTYP